MEVVPELGEALCGRGRGLELCVGVQKVLLGTRRLVYALLIADGNWTMRLCPHISSFPERLAVVAEMKDDDLEVHDELIALLVALLWSIIMIQGGEGLCNLSDSTIRRRIVQ